MTKTFICNRCLDCTVEYHGDVPDNNRMRMCHECDRVTVFVLEEKK